MTEKQVLESTRYNLCLLKFRAEKYRKLGKYNEALDDLNQFLDIYPNNKVVLRFQEEAMIDISTKLLKMNPSNEEEILRIRAQAYIKIDKYDEAL
ncbi:17921_t:CDS:1, partial [Gigaspora margarita]